MAHNELHGHLKVEAMNGRVKQQQPVERTVSAAVGLISVAAPESRQQTSQHARPMGPMDLG